MLAVLRGADAELTNYKSGIDVTWGGTKGTDYQEEYLYHDKLLYDQKIVYLRDTTTITMAHNARNNANYHVTDGGRQIIGANGVDSLPGTGDEGVIRYKLDRDRQDSMKWANNTAGTQTSLVLPAYTAPFRLADLTYDGIVPVVGTVGSNGGNIASRSAYYFRGIRDSVAPSSGPGDEWHVLSYADDDRSFLQARSTATGNFIDQAFYASDGKTVLLVVNPKTPCLTLRVPGAVGTGQFYTTPAKAYWTPKIVPQTSYISGNVTIEITNLYGTNVFYRINGSGATPFIDAGGPSVTLSQADFPNTGATANTLEYYYAGNQAFTKTRTIMREPLFPSAGEPHGNYLWVDAAGYTKVTQRITRAPYSGQYLNYRNRGDFSGQLDWDGNANLGRRNAGANGGSHALKNAFVAKIEGFNFTRTGGSKSHGRYAKEMLLESPRNIDPLGFEMQHSADAIPNRELHYRGYYDANPMLEGIFAYDIMIANFKSTQVAGGITPIEDHFIRDRFAGFAYEAMQWSAGMTALDAPGMWGGARMMTAVSIAMIMRDYSSPYYGTSGFGTIQTKYPLCPYENDQLTWKEALFDGNKTKTTYPNLKWYTGISDNGNESLFFSQGEVAGGVTFDAGHWRDKVSYFSFGLMGTHLATWANMAKLWGAGKTDPLLELGIAKGTAGTLLGGKDAPPAADRFPMLTVLNSRWLGAATNALAWTQSLPANDNNSDDKSMQDAGVFGFAWYDDQALPPAGPSSLRTSP
ncbi:MAG: hypothetical protein B9S34_09515 [Opitutia bacterium Tous-C1TDCM]|nr:MAG: hypothetical protein B9S34_09515 [Opitutae bacterium Tous-C1TDCM]